MKRQFLIFATILLAGTDLWAQGFNANNGRNHPELNWQVAETEHFLIMYPERISGIEVQAAAIAEETYSALSKNFEITFDDKIRIYMTDEDEIVNGFAVPFKKSYTNIWVNLNDYGEYVAGSVKWLRKVISHELAHIFHYRSIWSPLGLWQFAIADPLPRFWTEGLAQYQTERWDSQRGDRWLRKAIFDSRPEFNDGQSFENGRLMYAAGNSQLRFFSEQYGDSSLVSLLSYRKKFLGIEYHDFGDAFKTVKDGGYEAFYEEWRKHMNIYYNTLAFQMERVDSLGSEELKLPGQAYVDMALSPDGTRMALLSLVSLQRPVRRLYIVQNDSTLKSRPVAEGNINADISWSRDGQAIFYSRLSRGQYGSLYHDVYRLELETGRETRITYSRKAKYPVQGPEDDTIGYIVNENGTGNLFTRNLKTDQEQRITNYGGDVQLLWPLWVERENAWLVLRFSETGNRNLVLTDLAGEVKQVLDEGSTDNRKPVLGPAGTRVAFTSLRDEVPNVFIYDFEADSSYRFTNLFTGGEVFGWMAEPDSLNGERLLIKASETKRHDRAYWVAENREVYEPNVILPESYASWRKKQPLNWIPFTIEPDESLIMETYPYRSFQNLTHALSIVLPYYSGSDNYGLFATTNWTEPLGKHAISALGWLSAADPGGKSYGAASYLNNQLYPSLLFSFYRLPESAHFYGDRFLVEELTGGEITASWPVEMLEAPYQNSRIDVRLRHVLADPYDRNRFDDTIRVPAPENGRQTDLRLVWAVKKQRPWRDNHLHPLDGSGLKVSLTAAEKILWSDVRFATADISAYSILPSAGMHRLFVYGRLQAQWGDPLPQNFIGFSRYDNPNLNLPAEVPLQLFNEAERVRGYRRFVAGRQVAFGSLEYRMPLISSLRTTFLGFLDFGSTSFSLFTDAGVVGDALQPDGTRDVETRWGTGAELKNSVSVLGLQFTHAVGVAQPTRQLFTDEKVDLYYRVRAAVPF